MSDNDWKMEAARLPAREIGEATVDLERTAPQWTTTTQDEDGHSRFKLAQIDRRDELGWLDVAIRDSTSSKQVHAAVSVAGCAAVQWRGMRRTKEKHKNTVKYENNKDMGPDTVKPVSYELEGRQGTMRGVLQNIVTNRNKEGWCNTSD